MNEALNYLWDKIMLRLEADLMPATINSWIKPLKPYGYDKLSHTLTIVAPSGIVRDTFRNRYEKTMTAAAKEIFGDGYLEISVRTREDLDSEPQIGQPEKPFRGSNLNDAYTFETFVRGKSNELACSASMYVAQSIANISLEGPMDRRERNSYNPLFLYGGVGLGKTHLMHSIGNYIHHVDPTIKVIYTTAENLTNEFINSIKERKNQEFRDKYRTIDALLVDDIQFLADKEGTQEEFFHTFNALYNANRQIVISSDRPPSELKTFHERLSSRFGDGTMVDIAAPDYELRTAILEKKLELRGIKFPADVIQYIAKNISSNIRVLEGALNTVANFAKLTNLEVTLDLAERALRNKVSEFDKPELSVELIQEVTARYFGIMKQDLISKKRTQNITQARHVAMYLCRKLIDKTHFQIGQSFGKRDHTSVIYACNKIADEIESNMELRDMAFELEKQFI